LQSEYSEKFLRIKQQTMFDALDSSTRNAVQLIAMENQLTQQELKQLVDSAIDLDMWDEKTLPARWHEWRESSNLKGREFKKWAMQQLDVQLAELRNNETVYQPKSPRQRSYRPMKVRLNKQTQGQKIFGMCPVKSDKTLCCNLRTIDAVKNCGFGCSYCSIQTMYTGQNVIFDEHFQEKLEAIELDPERYYHIGTGQSSDALMWGNKHNILDDMLSFARKWPRALVEFKTKSNNVAFLLQTDVPRNVICSWSLNPEIIIRNEEHLTANLSERLDAARAVADKNIRVAFHFHPMLHYRGWRQDYSGLIKQVLDRFRPEEIVFISFGALTFPKPILKKLRSYGIRSKINQTPMVANPEDKQTYPEGIKEQLFRHAYDAFAAWHRKVFFYLCMEEAKFWDVVFGYRYPDNETMEASLLASAWSKLIP